MRLTDLHTVMVEIYKQSEFKTFTGFQEHIHQIHVQTWGSTSIGFGGMGGAAMTLCWMIVVRSGNNWDVYHNSRYAYTLKCPNLHFFNHLQQHSLVAVKEAKETYIGDA